MSHSLVSTYGFKVLTAAQDYVVLADHNGREILHPYGSHIGYCLAEKSEDGGKK